MEKIMKTIIFASLLLTAPLCKAADDRYLHLVNEEAWTGAREVAQIVSYYWSIHKASRSNALNLDGYEIKSADDLNLRHLHSLSLNNNRLTDMPDSRKFPSLTELRLNGNKIATIPNKLCPSPLEHLRWLQGTQNVPFHYLMRLYLDNNQIQAIPDDFRLIRLIILSLNNNQIQAMPSTLLPNRLRRLYLNSNRIQAIPDDLSRHFLLEILSLNNNRIQAIDPHVLDLLPDLRELHVEENYLTEDNITELKAYAAGRENLTIFSDNQKKGLNYKGSRR